MLPPQPTSTLFPYTTLFRSPSSPKRFVQLLGNLKSYGNTQGFALDVCPHCTTFPRLNTNSMLAPADVLQIWAIHKSGELARESLYFASAKEAAGRGNLQEARSEEHTSELQSP